ncbi:MAG: fimbrial protein [Betaproteobacteria bacterium HGW-Betaproteobacteria-1]|jgi:type IV pilus assembly protein PilN|nr:MAG: fimbrial protein [Betaproteobacteria bacterium HGW-Betaproteobacteria-1]
MIRINLLPHRQIKRAERQRQFNLMLVATVVLAGAIIFMGNTYMGAKVSAQMERNQRLEAANAKLDKEIEEIKELKSQIGSVLERKQIVENLQSNRSQAVVVLDEVSRQLPEGTYLKLISQKGSVIDLEGVADTNARVATLVRNMSNSQWMEQPNLVQIQAVSIGNVRYNDFKMNVRLKAQQAPEVEAPKKPVGRKS